MLLLLVCFANAATSFQSGWTGEFSPTYSSESGGLAHALGDANGDGLADLLVTASSGSTRALFELYYGDGVLFEATPSWDAARTVSSSTSRAGAMGDLDGDGLSDVIVGMGGDKSSLSGEGVVRVFYSTATTPATSPDWSTKGGAASAALGTSVAALDVDGDGIDDLFAGKPGYTGSYTTEGGVVGWYGDTDGLPTTADWSATGGESGCAFGTVVSDGGDLNADGYADLVVASASCDGGKLDQGKIWVFYGASAGPSTTADWTYKGGTTGLGIGTAAAGVGDVNADGVDDLALGATGYDGSSTDMGQVLVFYGDSGGLGSTADWSATGSSGAGLGYSLAAGDPNGDGIRDLIVAAGVASSSRSGPLYVYEGSESGLPSRYSDYIYSTQSGANQGVVTLLDDLDRDGDDEIITAQGGWYQEDGSGYTGRVVVYEGGEESHLLSPFRYSGSATSQMVGRGALGLGDVDGDGYDDFAVKRYSTSLYDDMVDIFYGGTSDLQNYSRRLYGTLSSIDGFATGLASLDWNGDGYDDVLLTDTTPGEVFVYDGAATGISGSSSWSYTPTSGSLKSAGFGISAAAGDFDGDGMDDAAIGAYGYDGGGLTNQGAVALFTTWGTSYDDILVENQAGAKLGEEVTAGDFDGDGYADLVAGAPEWTNTASAEGAIFLFLGSAGGLSSTDDWAIAGGTSKLGLGSALDTIADLNGDGADELVVTLTASPYGVWLFYGQSGGFETSPDWTLESDSSTSVRSASVAGAGDVNHDGFGDLLIGLPYATEASTTVYYGEARIYTGGAAGIGDSPDYREVSDGKSDTFGSAVANLGDVDGDGGPEIGVGEPSADLGSYTSAGGFYVYSFDDQDLDGVLDGDDCADEDPTRYPGATETCNGIDDDCDGLIDDDDSGVEPGGFSRWYADDDGDGFGDPDDATLACDAPTGHTADTSDCDDSDADVHPGASEVCDGVDNDCDDWIDDADPEVDAGTMSAWYEDLDDDGYGDASITATACDAPAGYVALAGDCDLHSSTVNPGETELCNDLDDDCDDLIDDEDPSLAADSESTWYRDADGDGYGTDTLTTAACDVPAGYVAGAGDCDDADLELSPAATETCDGLDNDCDGLADDADAGLDLSTATTWYRDADDDGYGLADSTTMACVEPSGYTGRSGDCDDGEAAVSPGATEVCDGIDDDCDGLTDDADSSVSLATAITWYEDRDGDGYGSDGSVREACALPAGYASVAGDCDDASAGINPGRTEVCDSADTDEDCDGLADDRDSSATGETTVYGDGDGDGYGDPSVTASLCDLGDGYTTNAEDCDDDDAAINPAAEEICDPAATDEDCDGLADDLDRSASSAGKTTYYRDSDGDGYGVSTGTRAACARPDGYAAVSTDCDDGDADVHPGAAELCDSADTDEDCDGLADDLDSSASGQTPWYADVDSDGYGDSAPGGEACDGPTGSVAASGDCDDGSAAINPGKAEICDSADTDEDCDGLADDLDDSAAASTMTPWYADGDSDGYGDDGESVTTCDAPSGYAERAGDCDDSDAAWHPDAFESCSDPSDYNCDGSVGFSDSDGDGFAACEECDDGDADIHPDGLERCDGVDDDCDGEIDEDSAVDATTWYADADGDGYGDALVSTVSCAAPDGAVADGTDCDDSSAAWHPGATEACTDPSDYDCDGSVTYADRDGDGFPACEECDDGDAEIRPDAEERCDGADDDCDGEIDEDSAVDATTWYADADGDGYGDALVPTVSCAAPDGAVANATDCDDSDPAFNPGATEFCEDPTDYNCDGSVGYADEDEDGFAACEECDDSDATIRPDADERCDGVDDDCDGETDEDSAVDATTWYADADGDGYGDALVSTVSCAAPDGAVTDATDCDDADPAFNPGATESCDDPTDYNCDGAAGYADADGDGFPACEECDDGDAEIRPDAEERCDGVDNDCDGTTDVGAADASTWYIDADGDGYGDASRWTTECDAPAWSSAQAGDCDDGDPAVSPDAEEVCGDAVDNDCDGDVDGADETCGGDSGDSSDVSDTAETADSADPGGDSEADDTSSKADDGCRGCSSGGGLPGGPLGLLLAFAAARRRGRAAPGERRAQGNRI